MHTIATLYWFRFERHAQVELLLKPDDIPAGDLLATLHGQQVKIHIEAWPQPEREAGELNEAAVNK